MKFDKFKPVKLVDAKQTAQAFLPHLNINPLFDALCGEYIEGTNGRLVLNGGLPNFTAFGGEGNTNKSTIANSIALKIMSEHPSVYLSTYDTEGSFTTIRMAHLAERYPSLVDEDFHTGEGRYQLTSSINIPGEKWHDLLKAQNKEKQKDKDQLGTTPFRDPKIEDKIKPVKSHYPSIYILDSLSEFTTEELQGKIINEKKSIDNKENNMYFAHGSLQKTKMVSTFNTFLPRAGQFVIATMHKGEFMNMDGGPVRKRLNYMAQGMKFKGAPKNIEFMTFHCWDITSAKPLFNSDRSDVLYPTKISGEGSQSRTDLMEVCFQGLRNKSGPSGIGIMLVVSQSSGVLWGLSNYHFLWTYRYGLEETGYRYEVHLYPGQTYMRTTIRDAIDEDPKLTRALELSAELAINVMYRDKFPNKYRVKLTDLYKGLIEKGYDWEKIYQTRGYWLFKEEEEAFGSDCPTYVNVVDLIRCYLGEIEIPELKK